MLESKDNFRLGYTYKQVPDIVALAEYVTVTYSVFKVENLVLEVLEAEYHYIISKVFIWFIKCLSQLSHLSS